MDWSSQVGWEPTTLDAVGDWWHYALLEVYAKDDDDDNDMLQAWYRIL